MRRPALPGDKVKKLEEEQKRLSTQIEGLMGDWEKVEEELSALEG